MMIDVTFIGAQKVTINIVPSSPAAIALANEKKARETKYPFASLAVNQSFTVPIAEANVNSLQALCSRHSKDGKQFKLIKHTEPAVVEVARLA